MEATLEKPKALTDQEAGYLMGGAEPVKSSLLISSSTYLNNPLFRDLFAQMGLKRDGYDLPGAYLIPDINRAFGEVTDGQRLFGLLQQERDSLPEFATWLDARFTSDFKVEELEGFASDTLGAMVYAFIGKSGMQIDFMFRGEPANDFDYLNKRRVQNHDIEHMVTGLDPSPVGEVGLIIANTVAINNYFGDEFATDLNRHGLFLVSTGLMRMACHYGAVVPAYLEAIALGRSLGEKQKKPLFMIKWEDYLDWPIPAIREEFSFQDGPPHGYWHWTHDAAKG
ncbi:hypothetical protein D3Y57_19690 [Sphingomonas paeninsulae]|uniref:Ubiquinone biosynthesis protein Coq4 n=1 Tax=Sphingomonas paeninsulae TaxID=2319844 RepID=A0A494TK05_SPHPE|nr:Coq4 family protein [Sphingomonas paeninsulae]AYJ87742.1 hypothetical protein D3Y57_19690 [Sphingomonas paeninsulae]